MAKSKTRASGGELRSAAAYANKVDSGAYEVDIDGIQEAIDDYLSQARESGKYSVAGLCITLGVTRETLDAWRGGYFEVSDVHDDTVTHNEKLSRCLEMGILHIERYWEECDKSAVQSKHVKMLERSGAFEEKAKRGIGTPPFDMGSLKKFCK